MQRRAAALLLAAAVLLAAAPAAADIDVGEYRGKFRDKGHGLGVGLTLLPARRIGDPAGRLRIGPHWGCAFELQFTGAMGQLTTYNLIDSGIGGPACLPIGKGFMRLHPRGRGIQVEFVAPDGRVTRKFGMTKPK